MIQTLLHLIQLQKNTFIALEAKVDKLDINKLVNVLTSLNNLKANFYDSDGDKLKTVLVDLNKSSDVVNNEVVTNTKFKPPKT